ncbi:MAG: signal peptide peptidase SppA [Altererythrobacter sp.]|nr:signal peptide peptidase SppA [Altererythrobacter sp.]
MSFAGKVWRLLVGIKDALSLIFLLLFFTALFAVLSARPSPGAVREGALLLDLDGTVVEEVSPIDPLTTLLSSAVPTQEYAARDLVRAIDAAKDDKRIKAIALDMSTFLGGGLVHMIEIGEALDRFRAAGKPVLAYAVAYTDDSLLLAAHASEVWVDPMGGVAIEGPGGKNLYYAGLLDKLKVKAHVFRVGTYKSAVEPYLLTGMSPEARENYRQLYGSMWQEWQANVNKARPNARIADVTGDVTGWIAASNGDLAQAAIAAGLADRAGTRVEWGQRVAQVAGEDRWDDTPGAFAHSELEAWLADRAPSTRGPAIGVVTIAGEISDGDAGPGSAGAERIGGLLDDALSSDLKALVVRVDSPGGTVTGSEAIRRAILRHKAKGIPIVVSMGNVAASGGYWVSTAADRIFAEPETITGSIGIFGVVPTFEDTLAQFGVTADGVTTTSLSGQPDVIGGLTPDAQAVLQATVESGYQRFLGLVGQARGKTPEQVDAIGQGRVWDGGTARQVGLVDQFGNLDDALAYAAAQAKLADGAWHAEYLGAGQDRYAPLIRRILRRNGEARGGEASGGDMFALFARRQAGLATRVLADMRGMLQVRGAQARCMECPAPPAMPGADGAEAASSPLRFLARLLLD